MVQGDGHGGGAKVTCDLSAQSGTTLKGNNACERGLRGAFEAVTPSNDTRSGHEMTPLQTSTLFAAVISTEGYWNLSWGNFRGTFKLYCQIWY